jgi:methylmalonyl-CoA/ethylmalonyl-CoA epimerase
VILTRAPAGSIARVAARAIHHVGIAVEDLEAAVVTYGRLFGAEVEHRETVADQGLDVALLRIGEDRIELLAAHGDETPVGKFLSKRGAGVHHVAFEVDGVAFELDRLAAAGVELVDDRPRRGILGHEIAFVHPDATGGVLAELVGRG